MKFKTKSDMRMSLFSRKNCSGKSLSLFRYAAMVALLCVLGVGEMWAGHDKHTATLNVEVGTGSGTVYASTSGTATSGSASVSGDCDGDEDGPHQHTFYAYATPSSGYTFLGWTESKTSTAGADASNPKAYTINNGESDVTKTLYAHFVEKAKVNITFVAPTNGTYTIKVNGGSTETVSSSNVVKNNVTDVTLTATPASGYAFAGWYKLNSSGGFVEDISIASPYDASFTVAGTIQIGARFVPTTLGKFIIKGNGTQYYGLKAATIAAGGSGIIVPVAEETVVDGSDLMPFDNGYTIKAGATLLIPHSSANTVQIEPEVVTTEATLSAYRTLLFTDGANVICNGTICVGGKIMSAGGGKKSAYVTGPCGVINMANGGHIELNSGSKLYCWGFIKGQDMDQGNNTVGVGTITANSGALIKEDFEVGDWRGGTATSAIYDKRSSWKLFPFQSYSIQNVEVPTTYKYGSTLNTFVVVSGGGGNNPADFDMVGNSNTLFLLQNAQSVVRKWYDPTTDLMCYELSGSAKLDALNLVVYISVSSSDYYLPISNSMHIILKNCNMTLSKPITMQAGSVIEIKDDATANLEARMHLFDKDEWGKFIHNYYFRSFNNLTSHKNRGEENSNEGLEDAKLIVDGTLNVVSGKGYLYSTNGGANVMGNGGGKIVFGGSLPSSGTLHHVTVGTEAQSYIVDAPVTIAAANLCNEDNSYTQSAASTTFCNINGRWFTQAAATANKADHTYDFTYISSGAVSGSTGNNTTTDAVYSWDKTGLELRQKWFNVTADGCSNWWHGQGDQSTWFYNWTMHSAWHQFMPTATNGLYSGSNNTLYTKSGCTWEELGSTDVNCLYEIDGVKKALVDGQFVALEPNNNDPAYHGAEDPTKYYICFEGCNWHAATKYEGENKAYVVDETTFIWFEDKWMAVERDEPFFFTKDETNVTVYYEYIGSDWVVAMPYVEVSDAFETRPLFRFSEAITIASNKKNATIKLLRDFVNITTPMTFTAQNTTCTLDLNGHVAEVHVVDVGDKSKYYPKMLTLNGSGTMFTITDNTTEKKGELKLIASVSTETNTNRWYGVYVQNGSLVLQSGKVYVEHPFAWVSNKNTGFIGGILVASAKTFTMNGGTLEVVSDYNTYGIEGASGTPIININGGTLETVAEKKDSPYGIYAYGTINVTGGTINAIAKASTSAMGVYVIGSSSYQGTANISGGAILARATGSAQAVRCWGSATVTGDYNAETPDNTPKARYYAKMYITGGTITAECTTKTIAYGVLSYGTTEISGGTITATVQKSDQNTAYGVCTLGGTTTIKTGANITANAPTKAYGVYCSGANGDSNRGWPHLGNVNIQGGAITANTTNTTIAYGLYVTGATWTINKSNSYSVFNGDYASAGTATVTGGTFYANAKTTGAGGILVDNTVTKNDASATPVCTINGGYYQATGTGTLNGCAGTALPANFHINGGYYSHDGGLATYAVSPKQVVTLLQTDPNRPDYEYKVAEAYTVTFKNGDTQLQSGYQEVGKSPVYEGDAPTKASTTTASYVFDGWSTTDGGALVSPLPALTSAGATYYAHFAETTLKYMTTFDAKTNGGNEDAQVIYVEPAESVGTLPTATKTGYTFNGWYTAASGGTKITSATVPTGDVTYFAQFTVNSYNLTWVLGDGGKVATAGKYGSTSWPAKNSTETPTTKAVPYGSALTAPVVSRTGYTFVNWGGAVAATMPAEALTYTAVWRANTNTKYTVNHYQQNMDGSSYPTEPSETEALTGTTATTVTPAVKNYDGFNSPSAQTVTIAGDGSTEVNYYYPRLVYTFTLDAYTNGGTSEVPSIEVIHGATIGAVPPDAQKGCNDFTGWYTKPVGGVKITPEFVIEYDMKTLYAQFSDDVRTYPIIYNAGANGTGTVDAGTKTCGVNTTLSSSTFTRTGYTQTGWSLTDGGAKTYERGGSYTANAALTLYPFWTINQYTISFNSAGGSDVASITQDYNTAVTTPANPSRTGYTFNGWSPAVPSVMPASNTECVAQWTINQYTISFDSDGGSEVASITQDYNTSVEAPANPTKTGYTFNGWNPAVPETMPAENTECVAQWTINSHTLAWNWDGGETSSADYTAAGSVVYGTALVYPADNTMTKANYVFSGWSINAATMPDENITITAQWTPAVASVTAGGTTYYTSLASAITEAAKTDNSTVTVLSDISGISTAMTYAPSAARKCTLDLNGHTVAGSVTGLLTINKAGATMTIVDNSSANPIGQLRLVSSGNANRYCVYVQKGNLILNSGSIYAQNTTAYSSSNTSVGASAVYVGNASTYTFTMNNGNLEAKAKYRAHGFYSYGKTEIKGGTIIATVIPTADGGKSNAYGAYSAANTTTISGNPTFTINAPTAAYGAFAAGNTPDKKTGAATNGTVDVQGGTFNVTATDGAAYGVHANAGKRAISSTASGYTPGNYTSFGTVKVSGGEFNISGTTTVYGINVVKTSLSALTVGETTYPAVTKYGNATITGGKFNMTSSGGTAYAMNSAATATYLRVQGGYYSTKRTDASETSNIEDKYTAPTKSCNYWVLDKDDATYKYEVAEAYKVTWNATTNGGSCATAYTIVKKSAAIGTLPEASKTGSDFNGWFTAASEGTQVTAATTITAAKTYYAQFAPQAYSIAYKDQGDVTFSGVHGEGYPTTHTYGTATALVSPTKTGYTFEGWYDNADCTGTALTEVGATAYTANFTLYAKWTIKQYKVTFDSNGGSAVSTIEQDYNSAVIAPEDPTKTGYTFAGWSPEVPSVMPAEDTECVAQWTPNTNTAYTVNHYQQNLDGTYPDEPTDTDNETGTTDTEVTPAVKDYIGFTAPSTQTVSILADGSQVVTYQYTRNSYNLTWDANGGELTGTYTSGLVLFGATITAPKANRANYDFDGWDEEPAATMPAEDKTYTAQWSLSAVTILWKSEDGEETLETDDLVLIGATPSFDGTEPTKATTESYTYTFDGWTTEANGAGTFYAIGELPTVSSAATYYAHFNATANVASVKVGSTTTYYTTIDAAFAHVNLQTANTELKLLRNTTATASLVFTPAAAITCTFDLNNCTLSGELGRLIDVKLAKSTFIITDNSVAKGGKVDNNYNANERVYGVVLTAGTFKLQNGAIYSTNPHTYSSATANKSSAATAVYVASGQTFTMENGMVESASQYASYAIYMARGTSTVTIKNGLVKGRTTKSTTAAGIYNLGKGLTVNGGHIVAHAYTTTAYGIYLYGGHGTINGGTIEATNDTTDKKGSTTTYGIYVNYYNSTYKGVLTIPSTSTVEVFAKARTNTSYAIVVGGGSTGNTIAGGTFTAKTKTGKTAYCVNSSGNITISGGTFTANAATTNAYGLYSVRGTITVNGNPTFNVTAGSTTAYGALAYGTIGKKGTGKYSGTIEINGGTFNVTSTKETAWGAYAGLASRDLRSCSATNDTVPGLHYMPGILVVNDGTFNVKATTTGAFGIVVAKAKSESGTVGTTARIPLGTVTGGKFKVESMGDANATAYAMNSATTAAKLVVQGGYYNTKRTDASETSNIEDKYTAPTLSNNYRVLDLPEEELPYKYKVAEAYQITFNDEDGTLLQQSYQEKNTSPVYAGETPTKAEDASYTYAFNTWSPALASVTAAATYTATYTGTPRTYNITLNTDGGTINAGNVETYTVGTGATLPVDVTKDGFTFNGWFDNDGLTGDAIYSISTTATGNKDFWAKWTENETGSIDIIGATSTSLTINATPWTLSKWPYTVNGKSYGRDGKPGSDYQCNTDRTITITHDKAADEQLWITVSDKNDDEIIHLKYTIPHVYEENATLDGTDANSIVFVNRGTLTVSDTQTAKAIYVAAGAELKVTGTINVEKLVLRTSPWSAAILTNEGTINATHTYYSRVVADNTRYYQFGLPCSSSTESVILSDGSSPNASSWQLMEYSESERAKNGISDAGANWTSLSGTTISGGKGYELFSASKYYREYYFPVTIADGETVAVSRTGESDAHSGWNIVASPKMGKYVSVPKPEDITICVLQEEGSYVQEIPETIMPAVPFSYQAPDNGSLVFGTTLSFNASKPSPRRRVAAMDEYEQIQWLHLDIKDDNNEGDQTSIYSHPTRYEEAYKTGIDVAKQSFTASRALIYSSHAYGAMAFAGVADSTLEKGVALTIYSPSAQSLTISMRENDWLTRMEYVWLIDKETGIRTDLLTDEYSFYATEGTTAGRFFIEGVFAPKVATDIPNDGMMNDESRMARKLLIDDKIYIDVNGRRYDATGKLVNGK